MRVLVNLAQLFRNAAKSCRDLIPHIVHPKLRVCKAAVACHAAAWSSRGIERSEIESSVEAVAELAEIALQVLGPQRVIGAVKEFLTD